MHLFEIIALDAADVPNLPIFAADYDMAVQLYMLWWSHHQHGDLPDLEVRKRNPGWPGLDRTFLASALQLDIAGVGRLDDNIGWTLFWPNHQNLGSLVMAMRSYDVHDQTTFAELVIAPSREEALRIARLHLASYRGQTSDQMTAIERLPGFGGAAAECLAAVTRAGVPGIAHLQADGAWLVLPAGTRPLAKSYPTAMRMHHFVDEDDYEVVLFAHSAARAADLFDAISHDYSVLPRSWLGSEWETWLAVGTVRHERQATDRGVEGLGIYTDQGWQILPLDYLALGINPPDL